MYQNVIYSSDEENNSNYSSYDSESTYDNDDAEKRNYYINKFQELAEKVEESNFQNNERKKLLSVIDYVNKLCIKWDKLTNDIDSIDAITKVILKKIEYNNEDGYRIVTDIINTCKRLKQDLKAVLIE